MFRKMKSIVFGGGNNNSTATNNTTNVQLSTNEQQQHQQHQQQHIDDDKENVQQQQHHQHDVTPEVTSPMSLHPLTPPTPPNWMRLTMNIPPMAALNNKQVESPTYQAQQQTQQLTQQQQIEIDTTPIDIWSIMIDSDVAAIRQGAAVTSTTKLRVLWQEYVASKSEKDRLVKLNMVLPHFIALLEEHGIDLQNMNDIFVGGNTKAFAFAVIKHFIKDIQELTHAHGSNKSEIVRYLTQCGPASCGFELIYTIELLSSCKAACDVMVEQSMPSCLVRVLQYMFVSPYTLLEEFKGVVEDRIINILYNIISHKGALEELQRTDALALFFSLLANNQQSHNALRIKMMLIPHALTDLQSNTIHYINDKKIIHNAIHSLSSGSGVSGVSGSSGQQHTEASVRLIQVLVKLLQESCKRSVLLMDDFTRAGGYLLLVNTLVHLDQVAPSSHASPSLSSSTSTLSSPSLGSGSGSLSSKDNELFSCLLDCVYALTCVGHGPITLHHASEGLEIPYQKPITQSIIKDIAHQESIVRNEAAFKVFEQYFLRSNIEVRREQLLERILTLYTINPINYQLLRHHDTLAKFILMYAELGDLLKLHIMTIVSAVVTKLECVPFQELRAYSSLIMNGQPSLSTLDVVYQLITTIVNFDHKYRQMIREAGLLDGLLSVIDRYRTQITLPPNHKLVEAYPIVLDATYMLLGDNTDNLNYARKCDLAQTLLTLVPHSFVRSKALRIVQQLIKHDPDTSQQEFNDLICTLKGRSTRMRTDIINAINKLFNISKFARDSFREHDGFVAILSVLLQLESCFKECDDYNNNGVGAPILDSCDNRDNKEEYIEQRLLLLEAICRVTTSAMSGNTNNRTSFEQQIGYSTFARGLIMTGVLQTEHATRVVSQLFDMTTENLSGRTDDDCCMPIRNVNAFIVIMDIIPEIANPVHVQEIVKRISQMANYGRSNQESLAKLSIPDWILTKFSETLVDSSDPLQPHLLSLMQTVGANCLSASELRQFVKLLQLDNSPAVLLKILAAMAQSPPTPPYFEFNPNDKLSYAYIHLPLQQHAWPPASGYTILFWLYIEKSGPQIDLMHLYSDDKKSSVALLIKNGTMMLSVLNGNKFTIEFPERFEQGRWYHVGLVHYNRRLLAGSEVKLFINGFPSKHTVSKAQYPAMATAGSNLFCEIGTGAIGNRYPGEQIWRIGQFYMIEDTLNTEHINSIFFLGPNYCANFQGKFAPYQTFEIINHHNLVAIEELKYHDSLGPLNFTKMSIKVDEKSILVGLCADNKRIKVRGQCVKSTSEKTQLPPQIDCVIGETRNNVDFGVKDIDFTEEIINQSVRHQRGQLMGCIEAFRGNKVADDIAKIGGMSVILMLLEKAKTHETFEDAIRLLVGVVQNHPKNTHEMTQINGYEVMAWILKSRPHLFTTSTVDLLFDLVGINGNTTVTGVVNRREGTISNWSACKRLLMNHTIWKHLSVELRQYMLMGLHDVIVDNHQYMFNTAILRKLRIVQDLFDILNTDTVCEETVNIVIKMLYAVFCEKLVEQDIGVLSAFLICGLNMKHQRRRHVPVDTRKNRIINSVLQMFLQVITVTKDTSAIYARVSPFWCFFFIREAHPPLSVSLALKIVCALFLIKPNYLATFIKKDGFRLLEVSLAKFHCHQEIYLTLLHLLLGSSPPALLDLHAAETPSRLDLHMLINLHRSSEKKLYSIDAAHLILSLIRRSFEEIKSPSNAAQFGSFVDSNFNMLAGGLSFSLSPMVALQTPPSGSMLPASPLSIAQSIDQPFPNTTPTSSTSTTTTTMMPSPISISQSSSTSLLSMDIGIAPTMSTSITIEAISNMNHTVLKYLEYLFNENPSFQTECYSVTTIEYLISILFPHETFALHPTTTMSTPLMDPTQQQNTGIGTGMKKDRVLDLILNLLCQIALSALHKSNKAIQIIEAVLDSTPTFAREEDIIAYHQRMLGDILYVMETNITKTEFVEMSDNRLVQGNFVKFCQMVVDRANIDSYKSIAKRVFLFLVRVLDKFDADDRRSPKQVQQLYRSLNRVILLLLTSPELEAERYFTINHIINHQRIVISANTGDTDFVLSFCYRLYKLIGEDTTGTALKLWALLLLLRSPFSDTIDSLLCLKSQNRGGEVLDLRPGFELMVNDINRFEEWLRENQTSVEVVFEENAKRVHQAYLKTEKKIEVENSSAYSSAKKDREARRDRDKKRVSDNSLENQIHTSKKIGQFKAAETERAKRIKNNEKSRNRFISKQLKMMLDQVTRERAVWGPSGSSPLDKFKLDSTEGPYRMRKKMEKNYDFYKNYRYIEAATVAESEAATIIDSSSVMAPTSEDSKSFMELIRDPSTVNQIESAYWKTLESTESPEASPMLLSSTANMPPPPPPPPTTGSDNTRSRPSTPATPSSNKGTLSSSGGSSSSINSMDITSTSSSINTKLISESTIDTSASDLTPPESLRSSTDESIVQSPCAHGLADDNNNNNNNNDEDDETATDDMSSSLPVHNAPLDHDVDIAEANMDDTDSDNDDTNNSMSNNNNNNGSEEEDNLSFTRMLDTTDQAFMRAKKEGDPRLSTVLYNCGAIDGMDKVESIFLLCVHNMYIINGYSKDDKTGEISEVEEKLNLEWLLEGSLMPTRKVISHNCLKLSYDDVQDILKRRYLLRDVAIELFSTDGRNTLVVFSDSLTRDAIHNDVVMNMPGYATAGDIGTLSSSHNVEDERASSMWRKSQTLLWQQGLISNFQYLMYLNTLAGRTYNDLTQYPVFPWILSDYTSEELDLANPAIYRDLAKPMGAQCPVRAQKFTERFECWDDQEINELGHLVPKFHYGTHYSSSAIVLYYLLRLEPFSQRHLKMQSGRWDQADRLFNSIADTWAVSSKGSMTSINELIPEFFYLPDFLRNDNRFNFGTTQTDEVIDDVVLPPWAKGSAQEFVNMHRKALESDYVSEHLHEWIDLIFGYKQQGKAAEDALNVFYYLTYEGTVNVDSITDHIKKEAAITQINSYGQTPRQLFDKPHEKRNPANYTVPFYYKTMGSVLIKDIGEPVGQIRVLNERTHFIAGLTKHFVSPNYHSYILWGLPDGSIRLHINDIRGSVRVLEDHHDGPLTILTSTSDGYTGVSGGADSMICVYNMRQKKLSLAKRLVGHTGSITALTTSRSYSVIVSGSEDHTCIIWDLNRLTYSKTLTGHDSPISCVAVHDTTGDVATCAGSTINIYSINGQLILSHRTSQIVYDQITSCLWAKGREWLGENVLITGHRDGKIKVWSMENQPIAQTTSSSSAVGVVVEDAPVEQFAGTRKTSCPNTRKIELVLRMTLNNPTSHINSITTLYLTLDQQKLYSGDIDGKVYAWSEMDLPTQGRQRTWSVSAPKPNIH
ncbi:hypothetical protein SAMD00019534_010580 [Acytostelium subglobosum LB1]|uniref:hypothetical protein n=1 Tax=Acytostelium subglobosum LB1 TaxID=1410327 RepID=UPI000644C1D4|nr:hypothetical protein SAMD00019534_010580 [Acytostelium subglobosum LB1]GAM17883.1 hypothetical protein SAMD00019534_010580 [Acytostelium subglobosum LB1]|eukprot:XP_012758479.1 hypothetical protein SAMD00019534_010580 [Acytostelium subglobosum LB1]